jgi:hypothetical protein
MPPSIKGIYFLLGIIIILLIGISLMISGIIPSFTNSVSANANKLPTEVIGGAPPARNAPPGNGGVQTGVLLSGPTGGPSLGCYKYNQCPEGKMCVLYPNQEFGECRDGTPPTRRK